MKVAEEILAYCSSCKMDLSATIVAMQGDRVVRVFCRTCKKERGYRPPAGATAPRAQTKTDKSPAAQKMSVADAWREQLQAARTKPLKTYSARLPFEPGDRVVHPQFGEGVVQKSVPPNKVEILFEMDIKTLIAGPQAARQFG